MTFPSVTPARRALLGVLHGHAGIFDELPGARVDRAAAGSGPNLTAVSLAEGTARGLAAIRRVGDASPEDKTLVDALAPDATALLAAKGTRPAEAWAGGGRWRLAGGAGHGVPDARRGRASYLGQRATGIPDPGAVGVALLFASASGTVDTLAHPVTVG